MKKFILLASLSMLVNILFSQSIDDGKKFLNYEKFTSAQDVFSKLIAANPNNVEATYWLGQTYLQNQDNTDSVAAKTLYQKTLQANPNAPLMLVGVGETELMEGKKEDARNRFETAISLTKGKDAGVLAAVGRANIDARNGDPVYAIEKLKLAADKDKKNSQLQVLIGDAYRKMIDGANATVAYQNAASIDPQNARAPFMIGRIYETQGFGQEAIYMKYYNDAIAADAKFAPVFYWLYNYYYKRDVNKSRDYLNKYIAVADADSKNCYAEASLLYVSQLYQEAITKSDQCITAGGTKVFPNLYGLKAYSYDKLGDSLNAKKYFEEFFTKVNPDKIGPNDYATYGKVLLKFPGNDSLAAIYVDKAVQLDTVPANKLDYVKSTAASLATAQQFAAAGNWYTKILTLKPDYGKVDLYYAGYNDYRGGQYQKADSIFGLYMQKYPEDIFGAYMRARSAEGIDSTGEQGLAKPYYQKVIDISDTTADKSTVKDKLIPAYRYMVASAYNVQKDKITAMQFNDKILAIDPADATALKTKDALMGATIKQKTKTDEDNTIVKEKTKTGDKKEKVQSVKTKIKKK
ncbi:MAG TPA: tetratricopeptide repeat protein [Chitinophagaceae bacterium]|nr:tetratricopeptide repeat protein [Chitinophagaceae bacterium]